MKKFLIFVLIFFLLTSTIKAQNIGDSCLNNNECNSDVCQGGECRPQSIITLINNLLQEAKDILLPVVPIIISQPDEEPSKKHKKIKIITYCFEDWECTGWSACMNEKQERTCTDLNNCDSEFYKPEEIRSCQITPLASCNDGILNQGEENVDCGGPCPSCKSCFDSKQNCHDQDCELGLDCGGPCMPCVLEKASHKTSFWVIFITIFLVLIILIVGFWYWKLRGGAEKVGKFAQESMSSKLKI